MRLVCLVLFSFLIVSCWSNNLKQSSKEIIDDINNRNYSSIWDKYLEDSAKAEFATDFLTLKEHPLGLKTMSMIGIPEYKLKTMTAEEYFGYILVFTMNMTDLFSNNTDNISTTLEIVGVDKIDADQAVIRWKNEVLAGKIELVRLDGKWYINIQED